MRDVSTQDIQTPPTPVSRNPPVTLNTVCSSSSRNDGNDGSSHQGSGGKERQGEASHRHHAFVKLILHIFTLINRGRSGSAVPLTDPGNNEQNH